MALRLGDATEDVFPQADHDPFFQTGDVRLGDAHEVGHFFLCLFLLSAQTETEADNISVSLR